MGVNRKSLCLQTIDKWIDFQTSQFQSKEDVPYINNDYRTILRGKEQKLCLLIKGKSSYLKSQLKGRKMSVVEVVCIHFKANVEFIMKIYNKRIQTFFTCFRVLYSLNME